MEIEGFFQNESTIPLTLQIDSGHPGQKLRHNWLGVRPVGLEQGRSQACTEVGTQTEAKYFCVQPMREQRSCGYLKSRLSRAYVRFKSVHC